MINLSGQNVILGNLYAPNVDDPDFFLQLSKIILDFGDFPVILGGDYNQVLDVFLDRSGRSTVKPSRTLDAIKALCNNMGLYDAWRLLNPSSRDYTFFSNRHSVYSRIDYFLISHALIEKIAACSIGTIAMTDHAPIDLVVSLGVAQERSKGWRMNTSVLHNEGLCVNLREHISTFFEVNNGTAEQANVWDAFKAYIRGILIQQTALTKKQDKLRISKYGEELKRLEKEYWENPNELSLEKLVKIKYELNTIFTKKPEYSLYRLKQKWYESGDKANKLLASQLKSREAARQIGGIRDKNGNGRLTVCLKSFMRSCTDQRGRWM